MSDDERVGRHERELAALKRLAYALADVEDHEDVTLFEAADRAAERVDELEREARTAETEEVFRP